MRSLFIYTHRMIGVISPWVPVNLLRIYRRNHMCGRRSEFCNPRKVMSRKGTYTSSSQWDLSNFLKLPVHRNHDDVIKWKHFPRYWPFVRGIHRSPVNSPHKGQRRGALMFSLICASINRWGNNREAGDLRRHRAHYDVNAMISVIISRRY